MKRAEATSVVPNNHFISLQVVKYIRYPLYYTVEKVRYLFTAIQ